MKPSENPDSPFREMFEKLERKFDAIFDRFSEPNLHGDLSVPTPISGEISDSN